MHTSCIIWSYPLCKNVEYTAKIGFNPALAIPAARVTACCSAIPTSKNLFLYIFANSFKPVPSGIAAVIATISLSSLANSIIASPNTLEYVFFGDINDSPLSKSKGETPWNLFGFFSANSYPFPFWVIVWIITGPFIDFALLNTSFISSISWPSIGPIYLIPIFSNNIGSTIKCFKLSFTLCKHWTTVFPASLWLSVLLISCLSLLYPGPTLSLFKWFDNAPTFLEIDIWLSFKTIIILVLLNPTSSSASNAIPPVNAPSPITAITL